MSFVLAKIRTRASAGSAVRSLNARSDWGPLRMSTSMGGPIDVELAKHIVSLRPVPKKADGWGLPGGGYHLSVVAACLPKGCFEKVRLYAAPAHPCCLVAIGDPITVTTALSQGELQGIVTDIIDHSNYHTPGGDVRVDYGDGKSDYQYYPLQPHRRMPMSTAQYVGCPVSSCSDMIFLMSLLTLQIAFPFSGCWLCHCLSPIWVRGMANPPATQKPPLRKTRRHLNYEPGDTIQDKWTSKSTIHQAIYALKCETWIKRVWLLPDPGFRSTRRPVHRLHRHGATSTHRVSPSVMHGMDWSVLAVHLAQGQRR